MFEFGFVAMNGFCGALVGSLTFFAVAAAPLKLGSDGVPASAMGSALAVALSARVTAAVATATTDARTRTAATFRNPLSRWL